MQNELPANSKHLALITMLTPHLATVRYRCDDPARAPYLDRIAYISAHGIVRDGPTGSNVPWGDVEFFELHGPVPA